MGVVHIYGGIAQLARALGSYPSCPRFESRCRYQFPNGGGRRRLGESLRTPAAKWRVGQTVKTPPFHGGNTGSIPVRVTIPLGEYQPYGGIAQPVERPPHTRKVTDSSSVVSTMRRTTPKGVVLLLFLTVRRATSSNHCF